MTMHDMPIGRLRPARPTRLRPEDRLHEGPVLDAEWWEDEPAQPVPQPPQRAQRHRPPNRAGHNIACSAYRQAYHFHA